MSASRIETWIQPGYELLGAEGIDRIKIERLARILKLNKSGFYHYFGNMRSYIEALLQYHISMAKRVATEIADTRNIDPDLLQLIVKHKSFFLVESQLLVKSRPAPGYTNINEAGKIINKELLALWKNTQGLPDDMSVAHGYLNIIRHFVYARIDTNNISYEFLHKLSVEIKEVLERTLREKNIGP